MSAYVANSNIEGLEKAFQSMEVDPNIVIDWNCYVIAANGYIKVGLIGKALEILKKSEKLITMKQRRVAYVSLLTGYDDIAGAEKFLEEWESGNTFYDIRVPNLLIVAYCKYGLVEKAEKLINMTVEKGKKPFANSWDYLATCYVEANQFPKALKAMESAFLARRPRWTPNRDTLTACLEYLKQQGDAEKTEEFVSTWGSQSYVN
ncbi:hypothetical protein IFM89_025250 [Coptis chinensis]|uniref:Pentatricopeptide repeat-containing protein n=1 Tax=Coptis chinensis TaxID=261450 RepID=A0A835LX66_9MAGN|nr:hypothetical protein IFM89_025250 [Coptis chinensis]